MMTQPAISTVYQTALLPVAICPGGMKLRANASIEQEDAAGQAYIVESCQILEETLRHVHVVVSACRDYRSYHSAPFADLADPSESFHGDGCRYPVMASTVTRVKTLPAFPFFCASMLCRTWFPHLLRSEYGFRKIILFLSNLVHSLNV